MFVQPVEAEVTSTIALNEVCVIARVEAARFTVLPTPVPAQSESEVGSEVPDLYPADERVILGLSLNLYGRLTVSFTKFPVSF